MTYNLSVKFSLNGSTIKERVINIYALTQLRLFDGRVRKYKSIEMHLLLHRC
jgi:hypothetical protein